MESASEAMRESGHLSAQPATAAMYYAMFLLECVSIGMPQGGEADTPNAKALGRLVKPLPATHRDACMNLWGK